MFGCVILNLAKTSQERFVGEPRPSAERQGYVLFSFPKSFRALNPIALVFQGSLKK